MEGDNACDWKPSIGLGSIGAEARRVRDGSSGTFVK
jgi:hypothetical protein